MAATSKNFVQSPPFVPFVSQHWVPSTLGGGSRALFSLKWASSPPSPLSRQAWLCVKDLLYHRCKMFQQRRASYETSASSGPCWNRWRSTFPMPWTSLPVSKKCPTLSKATHFFIRCSFANTSFASHSLKSCLLACCFFSPRTPLGRARAWLRLALMQKRLADYFKLLVEKKDDMLLWVKLSPSRNPWQISPLWKLSQLPTLCRKISL